MTGEQKEAFDKVLSRRSIKKDQKGFDGVVVMRRNQNKVIAPEKKLEDRLWEAADHMRANSALRLNEFAEPVLGLIFLKFAGVKFSKTEKEIAEERKSKTKSYGGASVARERPVSSADFHARGTLFVPEKARFSYLIELPEGTDMGKAVNDAMKEIEAENKELAGILPKSFQMLENRSIITLLKNFNQIPDNIEGDAFGRIYEYFLGKFAIADGSGGGEFFTPTSIVKLIVEILEPYRGYIYDPACGSGGMFVQSVEFIKRHFENGKKAKASREVSIYGQEKTDQTVRIAKMNLAIHGLSGDIRQGNTYYEDLHHSVGKFDFAMANPPFNVNGIDKERIKDDPRFPYGIPRNDNGNYLWIQIFLSGLKNTGRAGFVMANAASDAGHSEKEIRKQIIENNLVDVMVSLGTNMFYNVALPVQLWFLDKGKKNTERKNSVLFINARDIYTQVDKTHRELTNDQILQIASIVRSYRGEKDSKKYRDIKGLCRVLSINEIASNDYSLNPGRYVGTSESKSIKLPVDVQFKQFNQLLSRRSKIYRSLNKKIISGFKKYFSEYVWDNADFISPEILEKFAQLIYNDWFVNFNFPHAKEIELVDSGTDFGKIPKDWKVVQMKDIADVVDCLHSKKPSSIKDGKDFVLQLFNIGTNGRLILDQKYIVSESDYKEWTKRIVLRGGDCVVTNVGRVAAVAQIPNETEAALGRNMTGIRPTKIPNSYLIQYLLSQHMAQEVNKKKDSGTIMESLNVKGIYKLNLLLPTQDILDDFESLIAPIREAINFLVNSNNDHAS